VVTAGALEAEKVAKLQEEVEVVVIVAFP